MAGEGGMAHMIVSQRNNKRLLRRKRLFEKERTFLSIKKEYYKASQGRVDFKKATPEELKKIRNKVIANRKSENRIQLTVLCFSILIIGFIIFKIVKSENSITKAQQNSNMEVELIKKTEKYMFFISDGDKWISEKNWSNAIFQYKEALKVFPTEFDANYRLALAYSYSCQNEQINCEIGERLTERLIKQFPDKNEILKIDAIFRVNLVE
jgi:hypothetical protein